MNRVFKQDDFPSPQSPEALDIIGNRFALTEMDHKFVRRSGEQARSKTFCKNVIKDQFGKLQEEWTTEDEEGRSDLVPHRKMNKEESQENNNQALFKIEEHDNNLSLSDDGNETPEQEYQQSGRNINENEHDYERGEDDTVNINISVVPSRQQSIQLQSPTSESPLNRPSGISQNPNVRLTGILEIKLKLIRSIAIFLALGFLSIFVLWMVDGLTSYNPIFYTLYCLLVYLCIENILRVSFLERDYWRKLEDVLNIFDAISMVAFILLAQLKLTNTVSLSVGGVVSMMVTNSGYIILSKAPNPTKNKMIIIRCLITIQAFLISARLDKTLEWDWRLVFGVIWILMIVAILYLIAYSIIFVLVFLFILFRQRLFEELGKLEQTLGICWYIFFSCQSIILSIALFGFPQTSKGPERLELLRLAAMAGICVNGVLVFYTIAAFKPLVKFIQIFDSPEPRQTNAGPAQNQQNQRNCINLQVEKKESYFVMLSSTYFLSLENGYFGRNKENLQRVKNILSRLKFWKPQLRQEENYSKDISSQPINIEMLKGYKETLDQKFDKIANRSRFSNSGRKPVRSQRQKVPTMKVENYRRHFEETDSNHVQNQLHLSADDINLKDLNSHSPSEKGHNDENLCYLCCEKIPNAVLMNCGHGGICYDCASALVQTKNECMQCRSTVDMIYKIDPNPKLTDIIKAIEITKVG